MNKTTIKDLLNRYFEGKTELEEEAKLFHYFSVEEVEEEFLLYQPLFQAYGLEREQALPESFETEFDLALDAHINKEAFKKKRISKLRLLNRNWMLRAAVLVGLLLTLTWVIQKEEVGAQTASIDWSEYEPESPEEALQVYKEAMLKLGKSLNQGAKAAGSHVQKFDEVTQFFE